MASLLRPNLELPEPRERGIRIDPAALATAPRPRFSFALGGAARPRGRGEDHVLAGAFSDTVNEEHMGLINKTAGALILLLGVWVFFRGNSMAEKVAHDPNQATAKSDIAADEKDPNDS